MKRKKELKDLHFSPEEKMAILLNHLGKESSKKILAQMSDVSVLKIIKIMSKMDKAPIEVVNEILKEYHDALSENKEILFPQNMSKDLFLALFEDDSQLKNNSLDGDMDALEMTDMRSLANFLLNEHPQTMALILAHLDSEKKIEVFKFFKEGLQAELILRMANLDHVPTEIIQQVNSILKKELAHLGIMDLNLKGGTQPLAEMFNMMEKKHQLGLLNRLEEIDPELTLKIKDTMFVFDDLIYVDDMGIQNLLKEIDSQILLTALKNASSDVLEKIFSNISKRASQILKEDLNSLPPTRLSEVVAAQNQMVQKCKELVDQGKLTVQKGQREEDKLV